MIGIIFWVVEVGKIDIAHEISVLSLYLVQPRTGHFVQALHIFKYFDIHKDSDLEFNPAISELSEPITIDRKIKQMNNMYPEAVKYSPPNDLPLIVNPIHVSCFVDSNHAGDKITHHYQYGIILYCKLAPIVWYYKRQDTVDSSTFGSGFVTLQVASEIIISLRY